MIKVSVLYPNNDGGKFDIAYFRDKHVPMMREKLGSACKQIALEEGLGGPEPGSPATYMFMGHMYFDSVEAFQKAFGPHSDELMGDMPNYTNVKPVIQISEVKM